MLDIASAALAENDAAIAENRSVRERIGRRTQKEIGTALYRAYLQRPGRPRHARRHRF